LPAKSTKWALMPPRALWPLDNRHGSQQQVKGDNLLAIDLCACSGHGRINAFPCRAFHAWPKFGQCQGTLLPSTQPKFPFLFLDQWLAIINAKGWNRK
jgi:hypothetical protein